MKSYYLHITYKDISGKCRSTHICTEIDADTARRLVKAVGKTLSHVGGNGIEVDRREERSMVIIARVSTAPDRAYLTGATYYAEHDISLTPAERAAAAAWREHIATIQAAAYYTAEGHEVIGCTETMSRPKPGQPIVTVPEGWTAPAAEPETETVETAERAAEIADALDDIRRERVAYSYGYRAKQRVTARCLREAERAGRPTVRVGYCDLYGALSGIDPDYYTAGVYGWNCDVYVIAGLAICTGYRPAAGVRAVGVRELAEACRGADAATRDRLLAAWIVTNREMSREGARA